MKLIYHVALALKVDDKKQSIFKAQLRNSFNEQNNKAQNQYEFIYAVPLDAMNNMKKLIPYFLLAILFVIAIFVKQYRSRQSAEINSPSVHNAPNTNNTRENKQGSLDVFRDADAEYFFTKHARCRMACRKITQQEIKEIVRKADVNYNKSELDAARGPKYALEGYTSKDKQHIRVIVAPTQQHLSIVTVIDLDKDWTCPSCN